MALDLQHHEHALTWHRESLQLAWQIRDRAGIAACLEGLASVVWERARRESADQVLRFVAAAGVLRARVGAPLPPAQRPHREHLVTQLRAVCGEERFTCLWAEGEAMEIAEMVAVALGDPVAWTPTRSE